MRASTRARVVRVLLVASPHSGAGERRAVEARARARAWSVDMDPGSLNARVRGITLERDHVSRAREYERLAREVMEGFSSMEESDRARVREAFDEFIDHGALGVKRDA